MRIMQFGIAVLGLSLIIMHGSWLVALGVILFVWADGEMQAQK